MPRRTKDRELDEVLAALADRTRRHLLLAILAAPQISTTELSELVPRLGRHAVMKHLRTLEACSLVSSSKSGRVRTYQASSERVSRLLGLLLDDVVATEAQANRRGPRDSSQIVAMALGI